MLLRLPMSKTFLFLAWAALLFILQTSWLGPASGYRTIHIFLIFVCYLGITQEPATGLPAALLLGVLTDTFSGGSFGMFLILYLLAYLVGFSAGKKVYLQSVLYRVGAVLAMDVSFRLLLLNLLRVLEDAPVTDVTRVLPGILATALMSPVCFWVFDASLNRLEMLTHAGRAKPRARG